MNTMPGTAIRVLLVDDDGRLCELTSTQLERASDDVVTRYETDARDALATLDETDVDCIVSDYQMPGMDGLEFLEAVRERHADLPFILFTGRGSEEVASDAIAAGVTDYLQKSTGTEQYELLANRVENAVRQRRTESSLSRTRQRLLDERTQFAALFENTTDAIAAYEFVENEPVVRGVNPAFAETFGVDRADAVGRSLADIVVPPEATEESAAIDERVRAGERVECRVERRTTDGLRPFLLRSVPVDPQPQAVRSVPMDVSGDEVQGYAVYTDLSGRTAAANGGTVQAADSASSSD